MGLARYTQCGFRLVVFVLAGVSAAGLAVSIAAAQIAPPAASAPAATQPQAADWPQFMGPTMDQVAAPSAVPLARTFPAEGPPMVWSFDNLNAWGTFGGVSVWEGRVYVAERFPKIGDGGNYNLNLTKYSRNSVQEDGVRCLDLYTGREYWRYSHRANARPRFPGGCCVPAVDNRYVFATGLTGWLYCLDKTTGKELWKRDVAEQFGVWLWGTTGFCMSPALYKDTVVLPVLGVKAGVMAFDKATGAVRWQTPPITPDYHYNAYSGTAALAHFGGVDQFVVNTCFKKILGVEADTGKVLWEIADNRGVVANPVILEDSSRVIFTPYWTGRDRPTFQIAIGHGPDGFTAKLSDFDLGRICTDFPPVRHQGYLYGISGYQFDGTNRMFCADLATGKNTWSEKANTGFGSLIRSQEGLIYIMSDTGELRLLAPNPERYEELYKVKLNHKYGDMFSGLTLVEGYLIVRFDGRTVGYDVSDPAYPRPRPAGKPAPRKEALGTNSSVEALCEQLNAPEWEQRTAAVEGLGKLSGDAVSKLLPHLMQTLRSAPWPAQEAAAQVIKKLGSAAKAGAPDLVAIAQSAIKTRNWALAGLMLDTLTAVDAASIKEIAPSLTAAMKDPDPKVRMPALQMAEHLRPMASTVVDAVLDLHNGQDEVLSRSAIIALGDMETVAAKVVPVLIADLNKTPDVQYLAMAALRNIGPPAKGATPTLKQIAQDKSKATGGELEFYRMAMDTIKNLKAEIAPPVVQDVVATCLEGGVVNINLPFTSEDAATTEIVDRPTHGTWVNSFGNLNTIVYHAGYGYVGKDTFTWQATIATSQDKKIASRKATVTIDILPRNTEMLAVQAVVAQSDGRGLLVFFNKPVDPASAETAANYALEPGVRVEKAAVSPDGLRVTLIAAGLKANTTCTLTPANLRDRVTKETVPALAPFTFSVRPLAPGLTGNYYTKPDCAGTCEQRIDSQINFSKGSQSGKKDFSIRWTGKIIARHSEPYTFYVGNDVRLWVCDTRMGQPHITSETETFGGWPRLIASDKKETEERSATFDMEAGHLYEIRMESNQPGEGQTVTLSWSSPSTPKEIVPADCLFHIPPVQEKK